MEEKRLNRRRFLIAGATTAVAGCSSDSESSDGGSSDDRSAGDSTDGGQSSGTTATESDTETQTATSTPQSTSVVIGEVVSDDNLSMVVRDVSTTTSLSEFEEAESGNEFVIVRMAIKNESDDYIDFSGFWQTRLKDGSNHVYDATFSSTEKQLDSGTLVPGEVTRGDIVYEVPTSASGLTLQFDFASFDFFNFNRVTVDLENEASNIGNLSQSLQVDVRDTGATASKGDVSVTVHGVRTATELGSFTTPREGNEYVIPDITVTNNTGEPLSVSTLLQMRVKSAKGFAYTVDIGGLSSLDQAYNEGSEISPGQARRGELAFQVPRGSSPLYFIFDFLSFTDPFKAFWQLR